MVGIDKMLQIVYTYFYVFMVILILYTRMVFHTVGTHTEGLILANLVHIIMELFHYLCTETILTYYSNIDSE